MDGGRICRVKASACSLRRGALVVSLFAALIVPTQAAAATLPSGFSEHVVVGGLSSPVAASAPDGRVFVAEKAGVVKVAMPGEEAQSLLDISGRVNSYHDRGLLGLAVDRDFSQNGYLYLLYTYDVAPLQPEARKASSSTRLKLALSPTPTHRLPSLGSTLIVPIEWEAPSEGMQSSVVGRLRARSRVIAAQQHRLRGGGAVRADGHPRQPGHHGIDRLAGGTVGQNPPVERAMLVADLDPSQVKRVEHQLAR
jgi:hypothetical protein